MAEYGMTMTDEFKSTLAANLENYSLGEIKEIARLSSMIHNAKGQILDMFDMQDFSKAGVKEIARMLDMKLTKTVNLRCEVVFVGAAEIDIDSDGEDMDWEDVLDFSCEPNGEVDVDLTLDDVSIDVEDE